MKTFQKPFYALFDCFTLSLMNSAATTALRRKFCFDQDYNLKPTTEKEIKPKN